MVWIVMGLPDVIDPHSENAINDTVKLRFYENL